MADGIIYLRSNGQPSSREPVIGTLALIRELTGSSPKPVFFDARRWPAGDSGSWMTIIEAWESVFTAAAMLVDPESESPVDAYVRTIDRLLGPFEIFTDEAAAVEFLRSTS